MFQPLTIHPSAHRLPIFGIVGDVDRALEERNAIVVTAAPGAGKSTVLPITIYNGLGGNGKILMLEPRRLAARGVAQRMAFLTGSKLGEYIGYRIRFETKVSSLTRIEVITEGILAKMLLEDPTLEGVSAVIFDEFHERSLSSDESLAFVRECQRLVRDDLKIIVMSATIDSSSICKSLSAAHIDCEGMLFPIRTIYSEKDTDVRECSADVARAVLKAHRECEGDILAFLPGEAEIGRCAELLEGELNSTNIFPLFGSLPFEKQHFAIEPAPQGQRKVVLATTIAETSITIEGVRVVVDCGLVRTPVYDAQSGHTHLETVLISRDMADQRQGRSGRLASGTCYRLYREATFRAMAPCREPEIVTSDLTSLALDVAAWGESDAMNLQWITAPPQWRYSSARAALISIGAIDAEGRFTTRGRRICAMPCHPRIAKMLTDAGENPALTALAADIAAILEDTSARGSVDVDLRVDELRRFRSHVKSDSTATGNITRAGRNIERTARNIERAARNIERTGQNIERTARAAEQFRSIAGRFSGGRTCPEDNSPASWEDEGRLLAAAFPERVAVSRGIGHFLLAGGDTAGIDESEDLASCDLIVAAQTSIRKGTEGRIHLAARVSREDLMAMADVCDKVEWSAKDSALSARREWRIGNIVLDSKPLQGISREDIIDAIAAAAKTHGAGMFDFSSPEAGNLERRVASVRQWHPELDLPDLSQTSVLEHLSQWLPMYLDSTAANLRKIDICNVMWNMLSYEQQQEVNKYAPTHIIVPSGSHIALEYRQGNDIPVLRVRLQECFGLLDTPKVDCGRIPVLMELLSPGFKCVQLTRDLASFWGNTYFQVRSELRRRYPKHSWPDNPLEAEAVRGVRKK